MALTTSSGERYDALENFIAGTPNEYVKMEFDALAKGPHQLTPDNPGSMEWDPATTGSMNYHTDTREHQQSAIERSKEQKQQIEHNRDIMETMTPGTMEKFIEPTEPGTMDFLRSQDLGKEVVIAMNDNIPPSIGTTVPNISGGLSKPPKPANDNKPIHLAGDYTTSAPPAARLFSSTLLGDKSKITEKHFNPDELDILRETVEKAEAKGKSYIGYGDYGKGKEYEKTFIDTSGTDAFMHALTDKRSSLAFTLGMANFKRNEDNSITIKDKYHWAAKKEMVDKHRNFLSASKLMLEGLANNGLLGVGNVIGNFIAPSEEGRDVEIRIPPKEKK